MADSSKSDTATLVRLSTRCFAKVWLSKRDNQENLNIEQYIDPCKEREKLYSIKR